jgi:hypothetical protein
MDHKRSVSFEGSTICFIRVATHTPNNKNPTNTNLTISHGPSKRLDKDSGQDQGV